MALTIDKDRTDRRALFAMAAAAMAIGGATGAWLYWTGATGRTSLMMMVLGPVFGATISTVIAWAGLASVRRNRTPARYSYHDLGNYLFVLALALGFGGAVTMDSYGPAFAMFAAWLATVAILREQRNHD